MARPDSHPAHRARIAVGAASAGALVIISGLFAAHPGGATTTTTTTPGGQAAGGGDSGFQPPGDGSGGAVPFDPGSRFHGGGFGGQPQTSSHGS